MSKKNYKRVFKLCTLFIYFQSCWILLALIQPASADSEEGVKNFKNETIIQKTAEPPAGVFKPYLLNHVQVSVQWAKVLSWSENKTPSLLKASINESFLEHFLFLNLQYHILKWPGFLKWGLKTSAGLGRNYDVQSKHFTPLSLGAVIYVYLIDSIAPFVEWGYALWSVDFNEFSSVFPYLSAGLNISFNLLKPSLKYTLSDEYGIDDIGLSVESRWLFYKNYQFMHTIHAGLYLRF